MYLIIRQFDYENIKFKISKLILVVLIHNEIVLNLDFFLI